MAARIEELEPVALDLLQVSNLVVRKLSPVFRRAGITPQQWTALSAIARREEPPSLVALSRDLRVSKQNVTGMAARLEDLGLVKRAEDPADLRAAKLNLTRKGRAIYERTRPLYERWVEETFGGLSASQIRALRGALETMIAAGDE